MECAIKCEYPLPSATRHLQDREFGGIDTDRIWDDCAFTITEEGRLVQTAGDTPRPGAYKDIRPETFHGEIRLYCNDYVEINGHQRWIDREFSVLFADGEVISLTERPRR